MALRAETAITITVSRRNRNSAHLAGVAAIVTESVIRWDRGTAFLTGELRTSFYAAIAHDLVPTYYIIKIEIEI